MNDETKSRRRYSQRDYLASRLSFHEDKITSDAFDAEVMMRWESPLMRAHAAAIAFGDVLEIGFGMGLASAAIQERRPRSHTIIEIHPQVAERAIEFMVKRQRLREDVRVQVGDWRQLLATIAPRRPRFDGVFIDTYCDPHANQFADTIKPLLRPGAIVTMFNSQERASRWGFREDELTYIELDLARIAAPPVEYICRLDLYRLPVYFHEYKSNEVNLVRRLISQRVCEAFERC